MHVIDIPVFLNVPMPFEYPPGNSEIFEEYFSKRFMKELPDIGDYIYLPILWTSLYCRCGGKDGKYIEVDSLLNILDKNKRYFTIINYADHILNDISKLNIKVFSAGGFKQYKDKSIPIPLMTLPPKETNDYDKSIFSSFIGVIKNRHPIRELMYDILKDNPKYHISESTNYDHFLSTMRSSIFSLCPRGYGQTSFRICEALQNQSIPVYIYDDPIFPFNDQSEFEKYGICIHQSELSKIDQILTNKTELDINSYYKHGKIALKEYYSYDACYNKIISTLKAT